MERLPVRKTHLELERVSGRFPETVWKKFSDQTRLRADLDSCGESF